MIAPEGSKQITKTSSIVSFHLDSGRAERSYNYSLDRSLYWILDQSS